MVEVMVVVLILAIVATVGLPALNSSFNHARLSGAAEEVVNALQYAQLTAITSGQKVRVVIGHSDERIVLRQFSQIADLIGGNDELLANQVEGGNYLLMEYPLKKGTDYLIRMTDEDRFRGVDIVASNFPVDTPLHFDSLGSPSHGGSATLAFAGQQIVVTLDGLTGKVTVSQ